MAKKTITRFLEAICLISGVHPTNPYLPQIKRRRSASSYLIHIAVNDDVIARIDIQLRFRVFIRRVNQRIVGIFGNENLHLAFPRYVDELGVFVVRDDQACVDARVLENPSYCLVNCEIFVGIEERVVG